MVVVKKALIVGINAYPSPYQLTGCVNDANDFKAVMASKGFTITTLLDKAATRSKVLAAMNTIVTGRKANDMLIIAGSSHGSEANGHQAIVTCDMQAIWDYEIAAILNKAASGVKIDFAWDCCHSGDITRKLNPAVLGYKSIPSSAVKWPKETVIQPAFNHVAWEACRSDELAAEIAVDGIPRGAFAYPLCQSWRAGGTRAANIAYCEAQMAGWGLTQHPQLELPQSKADQAIFS